MQIALLTSAGMIYADAEKEDNAHRPDYFEQSFIDAAPIGSEILAPLLNHCKGFQEYQWAVAALSAFLGHGYFARLLSNVKLYEGKIHYSLLHQPVPVDPE